jgi:HEPN domain-containing protein
MRNQRLAEDYIRRAEIRLNALDTLFEAQSWADVVHESQEAVELALKGLLRLAYIDVPRVHDVSQALLDNREKLHEVVQPHVDRLAEHSRSLRRDRELSFYGSEDLTPRDFYRQQDAEQARRRARDTVAVVLRALDH